MTDCRQPRNSTKRWSTSPSGFGKQRSRGEVQAEHKVRRARFDKSDITSEGIEQVYANDKEAYGDD